MVKVESLGNDRDFLIFSNLHSVVSPSLRYLCGMGKALGIDYGMKRTGLAITDDLQMIATPLSGTDTAGLMKLLSDLIPKEGITDIVVGDPTLLSGEATHSTDAILAFCTQLMKSFPAIRVHRVDESFSSQEAMQAMVQGGMKKGQRRDKKTLDMVSATIILQRWLELR